MAELIPPGHKVTRITGGSVTAKRFAEIAANGTVTNANASTDEILGVFEDSQTTTSAACTVIFGPCVVEVDCAGTVSAGEKVECDANGKAVTQTTGIARGRAFTTATDGVVEIFLYPPKDRIADFTDSTTGTAGTTLAAGVGRYWVTFPVAAMTTLANGDYVTGYVPGHKFKIVDFKWVQGKAVTTGAKLCDANLEIGTTNLTGGVISLTSAACTPAGKIIDATAITAANTGSATDAISLEIANTTAFVEGDGAFLVELQNMDTADAFASLVKVLGQSGVTY